MRMIACVHSRPLRAAPGSLADLPGMPDFHSEEPHATDVFGGTGGWDVAARQLSLAALGVEWDAAACMTRRAAGLFTVEGDVRDFHPLDFERVPGFIASPPCQTFSAAGKGAGRAALDTAYQLAKTLEARQAVDFSVFSDERTGLVLEPLRWSSPRSTTTAPTGGSPSSRSRRPSPPENACPTPSRTRATTSLPASSPPSSTTCPRPASAYSSSPATTARSRSRAPATTKRLPMG